MMTNVAADGDVGARIRALREARGLQAQEFAAAIGLDPTIVSNIERGVRAVKTSELTKMARALRVSPLAILDEASLLARMPIAARALGVDVADSSVYEQLTGLAELHEVLSRGGIRSHPKLDDLPPVRDFYWKRAADLLAEWAFERFSEPTEETDRFTELRDFIQGQLGIDVLVGSSDKEDLFGAAITDRDFPLIFVASGQLRTRALFTLAHELGHVLTQDGFYYSADIDLEGKNERERLANAFAAAVLMPETLVRGMLDTGGRNARTIARMILQFGVSFESLVYRLYNLRVIDEQHRRLLHEGGWGALIAQFYADDETVGRLLSLKTAIVEPQPPLLLSGRMWEGFRRGVVSVRPLARLLGLDPEELLAKQPDVTSSWSGAVVPGPEVDEETLFSGDPV
jgi:Zn-dependent peptidase ImmA (M78 family)/transcriptional regulator with XRE-family HTH domain